MSQSMPFGKTPLTEQQARSLAYWWGGDYQQVFLAESGTTIRHGVVVRGSQNCRPRADAEAPPIMVFSLEEARDMENQRGFQEAASPDWVG
jgi:hypothetical protein